MQSEVLALGVSQIDLSVGTMRINPGGSKTGECRIVYLSSEIKRMLEEQIERVRTLSRTLGKMIPYLFPPCRRAVFKVSASVTFGRVGPVRVRRWDCLVCCAMISAAPPRKTLSGRVCQKS
jgi:integrase